MVKQALSRVQETVSDGSSDWYAIGNMDVISERSKGYKATDLHSKGAYG